MYNILRDFSLKQSGNRIGIRGKMRIAVSSQKKEKYTAAQLKIKNSRRRREEENARLEYSLNKKTQKIIEKLVIGFEGLKSMVRCDRLPG